MTTDEMLLFSRQFSLVLFFLLFVGIVLWAYWPKNKERFEKEARSILEEPDDP
ncbi:MAG: cbb3-type cytochrome c oxidase subunit 3 [Magnetococcus sp. YQC-5]